MAKTNELKLEREIVKTKGKEYGNYFVSCEVLGRKAKARIIPKDNGGYALLDILFMKSEGEPITLYRKVTKNTNANGQVTQTVNYTAVYAENEDGEVFEVAVKPYRVSDEDWIKMFIVTLPKEESISEEDNQSASDSGIEVNED